MEFTKKLNAFIFVITSSIMLLSPSAVIAAELVQNGSFETNDFTGWTVLDNGSGNFSTYTGTSTPANAATVLAPPDGSFAAVTEQTGPGDHIIYQDIIIPPASNATFSAIIYIDNLAGAFSKPSPDSLDSNDNPNQQMRVDIIDPTAPVNDIGAGVLLNIFQTNIGDPTTIGYTNLTANLSAFSGQTVRIRIAEVDNQGHFYGAVDKISVDSIATIPTSVPTLTQWSLFLLILSLGFFGMRYRNNI